MDIPPYDEVDRSLGGIESITMASYRKGIFEIYKCQRFHCGQVIEILHLQNLG